MFFSVCWCSWAGLPQHAFADRGKEWAGAFLHKISQFGVSVETAPLEAARQLGSLERKDGIWKETWRRVVQDCQVTGMSDCKATAAIVSQQLNESILHHDQTSANWVLGTHGVRVPGSLLQQAEAEKLEVQEACLDPDSLMAKNLARRESTKITIIRQDSCNRARRARHPRPCLSEVLFRLGALYTSAGSKSVREKAVHCNTAGKV